MERTFAFLSACGVEIELMTVENGTLTAAPYAKNILDEFEEDPGLSKNGVGISNELVQHVIEFKSAPPPVRPWAARNGWDESLRMIARSCEDKGYGLLGTGMHPWFNPSAETLLWAWEDAEIYQWYHRTFDCHRHGFANLQSIHLNIPFRTDDEFAVLHGAIRALLPLLPGLCASTPFIEGRISGMLDTRIDVYRNNQNRFPAIAGDVIPEALYSEEAYHDGVFKPLETLLATLPDSSIIDSQWLNSRGAIARFDRGSIEIRLMDAQECLDADLAVAELVFGAVTKLCSAGRRDQERLRSIHRNRLVPILNGAVTDGDAYVVEDEEYLSLLGMHAPHGKMTVRDIWKNLYEDAKMDGSVAADAGEVLGGYFASGCLSARILNACAGDFSRMSLEQVYRKLCACEMENRTFP